MMPDIYIHKKLLFIYKYQYIMCLFV